MPSSIGKKIMTNKLEKILSKVGDLNFKRRILTLLEYLELQEEDLVLDAGCGEGFYLMVLSELYNCRVVGIDNDNDLLKMAERWVAKYKNVTIQKQNLTTLNFPDNYFDKIICSEVLEHIVEDDKATEELFRVLKPGGKLAVTVPNSNYPLLWDPLNKIRGAMGLGHFNPKSGFWGGIWAYDHKRLYTPKELYLLLTKTGFSVKNLKVLTHYGVPFNHLVLYTGKQFYTTLPVGEEVRKAMEKFEWNTEDNYDHTKGIMSKILQRGLAFLTWVDSFNNKEFRLSTSSMAVAALAVKDYGNEDK